MITTIVAIAGTAFFLVALPIAVSILTDDAKAWLPKFALNLLRRAALRLPDEYSAEFYEEWVSHFEETPEITGKLWHAISIYLWGSRRTKCALAPENSTSSNYDRGKRIFDVCSVVLALPTFVPIVAALAYVVSLDGGTAFCGQDRLGRNGEKYRIWKLRTMVANPEQVLKAHLQANPRAAAELAITGRLRQDPRITKIGRVLRKYSLDELPKLWNVLNGEMSLVGPRPLLPEEKNIYPGKEYYQKRPGITGNWQVSDRQHTSYEDRAQFDDEYAKNMSLLNDLKLLWKTVVVVVTDFLR